jgi:hypothetical protein
MINNHAPKKDFVHRLEEQLTADFRRQERFQNHRQRLKIPRYLGVIILILSSMMAGVVIIKAAEQIKDSWKRELALAQVETALQIKEARLKVVKEIFDSVKEQKAKGLVGDEQLLNVKVAKDHMDLELARAKIDFQEVKATGRAPQNELFAPLVAGEDFVSHRLQLDKKRADLEVELLRKQMGVQIEQGQVSDGQLEVGNRVLLERKKATQEITYRLQLRTEFLQGKLTPWEVEIKEKLSKARDNLHQAERSHELLKLQLKRMGDLEKAGTIKTQEVNAIQYELTASEAQLRLARLEVSLLQQADK